MFGGYCLVLALTKLSRKSRLATSQEGETQGCRQGVRDSDVVNLVGMAI